MARDDAPWLAEAAPRQTRVSRRSFFITIASALALIAVVALGAFLLISRQEQNSGDGYMEASQAPLITAEPGPYKVKPEDPMGLDVEGQDQTLYAAGIGIDETSSIDLAAVPEEPLPRPGSAGQTANAPATPKNLLPPAMQPQTGAKTTPELPRWSNQSSPDLPRNDPVNAPQTPQKTPESPVLSNKPLIQLGAFSSRARAEAAWTGLTAKHGLIGVSPQYSTLERDGKTLWRLRGQGGNAAEICARLTKSGDSCSVVSQ